MSDPQDTVRSGAAPQSGREVSQDMSATTDPATGAEAMAMLESSIRFLAAEDVSGLPAEAAAERLQALERHNAMEAAVRGRLLVVFHAQDGHLADGQRNTRSWLIHTTGVTRGQAGEHQAVQAIARDHPALHAALAEGG